MPQPDVLPPAPRVRATITQEIIDRACREDSSHCMIAEAVRLAAPWARNISVDLQTIRISDPEREVRYTYLTPRSAQLALLDFDAGLAPPEFSFDLRNAQAHVNWMRRRAPKKEITEAQRAAVRHNLEKARKFSPLGIRVTEGGTDDRHPRRVGRTGGSRSAPVGALASGITGRPRNGDVPTGRRRQFGLRAIDASRRARAATTGE